MRHEVQDLQQYVHQTLLHKEKQTDRTCLPAGALALLFLHGAKEICVYMHLGGATLRETRCRSCISGMCPGCLVT